MRSFIVGMVLFSLLGSGIAGGWVAMNYYQPGTVGTPAHAGVVSQGAPQECTNVNFNVRPRETVARTISLETGDLVRATFGVNGGLGHVDIFMRVISPNGLDMLASPRAQNYDFGFPAQMRGDHTLLFDNRFSLYTSKSVGLYYCIDRAAD